MTQSPRIDRLKQMVAKRPNDSFARYGLAMEYKNLGNLETAIRIFAELVEQDPDYVAAYYHYGMALKDAGRPGQAEDVFQSGLQAAGRRHDPHASSELQRALDELRSEA